MCTLNATMISTAVDQWNQVNQQVAENQPRTHFVNVNSALTYGQYQSADAQAKLKTENRKITKHLSIQQKLKVVKDAG